MFSSITHQDGLLSAIKCDAVKLDELNLSSCSLPTTSLRHLALIVAASADTLQRIDLQGNSWDMTNPGALQDWEEFLTSFKSCVKMRRVDLSENRLGDKGIETFVRVYTREMRDILDEEEVEDISDELLSRSTSGVSTKSEDEEEEEPLTLAASIEYGSSPGSSLAASALIKSNRRPSDDMVGIPTRGLRSIAYIRLHNVGMTDISALHLTYLLPYHHLPHVLLRRLDAQIPDSSIGREDDLYDPEMLCRGVMYDIDNPELTPLGKKILETVEKVRRSGGMQPQVIQPPPSPLTGAFGSVPPSPDNFRGRNSNDVLRGYFPETPSPSRKESISSIRTMSTAHGRSGSIISISSPKMDIMPYWSEILKARPKIQGEILKISRNVHVSQLWSAGIKLLSLARIFTLPQPQKPPTSPNARIRIAKQRHIVKVSLPPSPISPTSPGAPKLTRSNCIGGLEKKLWMKILLLIADTGEVLSERQAMSIIDWAADRSTLAKEGEWAGKLQHVQMWKLLDVSSPASNLTYSVWIV